MTPAHAQEIPRVADGAKGRRQASALRSGFHHRKSNIALAIASPTFSAASTKWAAIARRHPMSAVSKQLVDERKVLV